jgi:hypothetical protein
MTARTPHQDFLAVRTKGDRRCRLAVCQIGGDDMTCIADLQEKDGIQSFVPLFVHISDVKRLIAAGKPTASREAPSAEDRPGSEPEAAAKNAAISIPEGAACTACGLHHAALTEIGCPQGKRPTACLLSRGVSTRC